MNNVELACDILNQFISQGLLEIVICPGARNAPFVEALSSQREIKVWTHFDERSAAFFALGRIKFLKSPVAVITTSGTAVAELLPATMEAYYSGLPLVLITADRPPHFRNTGAPQCVDQAHLLATYTKKSWDILTNESLELISPSNGPSHINVCFGEPLVQQTSVQLNATRRLHSNGVGICSNDEEKKLRSFLSEVNRPLVIVGELPIHERASVRHFLRSTQAACILEAPSGLREESSLQSQQLKSGDSFLLTQWETFDGVLRLGGVPTTKLWRKLENMKLPVLSISSLNFTGSPASLLIHLPCSRILPLLNLTTTYSYGDLFSKDSSAEKSLKKYLQTYPLSEPSLVEALSKFIQPSSIVYVGNSLPIRQWDLCASRDNHYDVFANRGANGIDGQLSSFLGVAQTERENWCLLGDLTTLYDLNAPWILSQLEMPYLNIVVINNSGGRIFERMFNNDLYLNKHQINFSEWAKMWNLPYEKWKSNQDFTKSSGRRVVELCPDPEQTNEFWEKQGWN